MDKNAESEASRVKKIWNSILYTPISKLKKQISKITPSHTKSLRIASLLSVQGLWEAY